jgi:hypothetical protein
MGERCENQNMLGCLTTINQKNESVDYKPTSTNRSFCIWKISLPDTRKVVKVWIDAFEQAETNKTATDCTGRDYVYLSDYGRSYLDSIGIFCRAGEVGERF